MLSFLSTFPVEAKVSVGILEFSDLSSEISSILGFFAGQSGFLSGFDLALELFIKDS